jgi:copper chaperone NosL
MFDNGLLILKKESQMIGGRHSGIAMFLTLAAISITTVLYAQADVEEHRRCFHCGMDRKAYGFSRMLLHFDDGTVIGVCSLHCAVAELEANGARKVKRIEVADRDTRDLIDAKKACWVIGGDKPGVMTETAKWAFAEKKRAEKFVKKHGGSVSSFKEAFDAASQPE